MVHWVVVVGRGAVVGGLVGGFVGGLVSGVVAGGTVPAG
jgi:hypothetical protein